MLTPAYAENPMVGGAAMFADKNIVAVSGDALTAQVKGKDLYIIDESGNAAKVTIAGVNQSNGVIHAVSKVLLPK